MAHPIDKRPLDPWHLDDDREADRPKPGSETSASAPWTVEHRAVALAEAIAPSAVIIGWLVLGSTPAALVVDYAGNVRGPAVARSTLRLDLAAIEHAVRSRQGVVLQFDRGRTDLPIVTGLLWAAESPLLELLERPKRETGRDREMLHADPPFEARVDGERVVVEAQLELVLRCGSSSIQLTREGKILIQGVYVESLAEGTNRIKGGAVRIN